MAQDDEQDGGGTVYKMKLVQFLGRSVPIVLQSDNGPCPLLSICNVLLLRNNVTINQDMSEISERDLLSLVAERLLDANYNLEGKDEEYVRNQQQNIADAISLLPRLATGIDVNVRFRNTQDFEFTTECAIFDLLDIGLYHGWICEDEETKSVIGADSYNTLADRLAALQASRSDSRTLERESSVDFNAAITATFTVPSPSLSSVAASLCSEYNDQSPDHSTDLSFGAGRGRKGDEQEVAQLLEALELSKSGARSPRLSSSGSLAAEDSGDYSAEVLSEGSPVREETVSSYAIPVRSPCHHPADSHTSTTLPLPESGETDGAGASLYWERAEDTGTEESHDLPDDVRNLGGTTSGDVEAVLVEVPGSRLHSDESIGHAPGCPKKVIDVDEHVRVEDGQSAAACHLDYHTGEGEALYEGEVVQRGPGSVQVDTKEPLYEGEAALGEQAHMQISGDDSVPGSVAGSTKEVENLEDEGSSGSRMEERLIENFLINSNQLTWSGLFNLQEEVKERELCVFFRNNHFSTMFKYNKDLYLLATDQGYLHQADLVWEKLDQVDGNHSFVTGNFAPFQADSTTGTWNEQPGPHRTEDYISKQAEPSGAGADYNSDLQLALALQQQEFEEQQQAPQQAEEVQARISEPAKPTQLARPSAGSAVGRLITGPRTTTKPEAKKEKCVIM